MQEVGEEDPSNVADEEDSLDSTDFQDGMCSVGLYVLTTLVCRIIPMPDETIQPNHGFPHHVCSSRIIIGPNILYRFTVAQPMISYVPNCINPLSFFHVPFVTLNAH